MTTKIIIERHGQSFGNAKGIYLGHTDLGLTEEGIMQATVTAEHLREEKIDAVYSSDLIRAYQTALPHAEIRGISVITSKNLREIFVGDWDGCPAADLRRDFAEDFNKNRFFYTFQYPNGESFSEAAERFYNEIFEIARKNEGKTVLVVSHSAVIRAFWYKMCGYESGNMAEKFDFMTNASYSTLTFDGEKFVPGHYFYDAHVPPTNVKPI